MDTPLIIFLFLFPDLAVFSFNSFGLFIYCVKRSTIIAKITKATPLTNPLPTCARCRADKTPRPKPGAPIIEAVTTIESDNIVV